MFDEFGVKEKCFLVRTKKGKYLNVSQTRPILTNRKYATRFVDRFSAEFMADLYELDYVIEEV